MTHQTIENQEWPRDYQPSTRKPPYPNKWPRSKATTYEAHHLAAKYDMSDITPRRPEADSHGAITQEPSMSIMYKSALGDYPSWPHGEVTSILSENNS